jgi:hypothetical protein
MREPMALESGEPGYRGTEGRQPVRRRRPDQWNEVAVRQVFEHEHRDAVAIDELVRPDEVRARDQAQDLVFAAQQRIGTRMPAQFALHDFQCRFASVGRDGSPHLGRAAAAKQLDGAPIA